MRDHLERRVLVHVEVTYLCWSLPWDSYAAAWTCGDWSCNSVARPSLSWISVMAIKSMADCLFLPPSSKLFPHKSDSNAKDVIAWNLALLFSPYLTYYRYGYMQVWPCQRGVKSTRRQSKGKCPAISAQKLRPITV